MELNDKKDFLKFKEIEKVRREYLSSVIHKLRTPLTPIREYILRILKGKTGEITTQQRRYLDIVFSQIERLINIVEGLSYDIKRLDAGRVELKDEPLSMIRLLEETLKEKEVEKLISEKKIDINIQKFLSWDIVINDKTVMLRILKKVISDIVISLNSKEKLNFIIRDSKEDSSRIILEMVYPLNVTMNRVNFNLIKTLVELQKGKIEERVKEGLKYLIFKFST